MGRRFHLGVKQTYIPTIKDWVPLPRPLGTAAMGFFAYMVQEWELRMSSMGFLPCLLGAQVMSSPKHTFAPAFTPCSHRWWSRFPYGHVAGGNLDCTKLKGVAGTAIGTGTGIGTRGLGGASGFLFRQSKPWTVQHCTVQHRPVRVYSTISDGTLWCSPVRCSVVHCSTVHCSEVQ